MSQTVALQRGSTSVTANGADYANFFTQSGGTATRVILNGIGLFTQTGTDYQIFCALLVKSAGSSTNVFTIGAKSFGNTSTPGFDFSPADGIADNVSGYAPTSTSAIGNKLAIAGMSSFTGATFGGSTFSQFMSITGGGSSTTLSGGQFNYSSVPRDFWIGPSDVVAMKLIGGNTRTFTIAYSFTTITES
jgi:hypothetical protein